MTLGFQLQKKTFYLNNNNLNKGGMCPYPPLLKKGVLYVQKNNYFILISYERNNY